MTKRNLLFIFTDEQRYDTLGAYGNKKINTPNLDKLAADSVLFEKAYVSQPVCTPSRATILTGLYPHNHTCVTNNIPLRKEHKTLVELGDFSTYRKAYIGKWHLGDEVFCQHGFDEWISTEDAFYRGSYAPERDKNTRSNYHEWLLEQGLNAPDRSNDGFCHFSRESSARLPEEYSKTVFTAEMTCKFLEENKDKSFIGYVNFLEPHMPFFGPRDNEYDPADVDLPSGFGLEGIEGLCARIRKRLENRNAHVAHVGVKYPNESQYRELIARYWGLVSQVDSAVGAILEKLKELGLYENTIIVFTSDHGDMMGSHDLITKGVMYEDAIRVPMLLRIPGHAKNGTRIDHSVSHVDLVPTLLDYLEKEPLDDLDGYSWQPVLDGTGTFQEENVFIEWDNPWVRTVITPDGWKLNMAEEDDFELYDLNSDPDEMINLYPKISTDLNASRQFISLRNLILEWQERTLDNPIGNSEVA